MINNNCAITLFSLASIFSLLQIATGSPTNSSLPNVDWGRCPDNAGFDCGSFRVPLDYAHPEVGDAVLAVARLNATKQPRMGTIFTNPGGPGGSGVAFLIQQAGPLISIITQGQYDIVSWDPRGVNQSRPQITCGFTSQNSFAQFLGNTILGVGVEARGSFIDPEDVDSFFSKVNETDAKIVQTGQQCLETDGSFLKYMGTTAVVRDMVALANTLEGPGKPINYWGFSYGTVIGNYFVNMFPDRVGRVIIDGVVDSIMQMGDPADFQASLSSTELVLQGLAETCGQAGPQNCSLAQKDARPSAIFQGIKDLIDRAYDLHKAGATNITSFQIREFISEQFHSPTAWDAQLVPQLESWAAALANATSGNASTTTQTRRSASNALSSRQTTNGSNVAVDPIVQEFISELVISCVDGIDQEHVTTQRVFEEVVSVTQELVPTVGEVVFTFGQIYCHRFPVRAVERFTGPFNSKLANPIVVVGNKADPITPFSGAQRIAETLGDSARLVKQNGLGHASFAENSDCIQSMVRDYFLSGVLPENGLVCETDQALFPPNSTLVNPNPILP